MKTTITKDIISGALATVIIFGCLLVPAAKKW